MVHLSDLRDILIIIVFHNADDLLLLFVKGVSHLVNVSIRFLDQLLAKPEVNPDQPIDLPLVLFQLAPNEVVEVLLGLIHLIGVVIAI